MVSYPFLKTYFALLRFKITIIKQFLMFTRLYIKIKIISLFKRYSTIMDNPGLNKEITSQHHLKDHTKKKSYKLWTEEEKANKKSRLKLRREEHKSNKSTSFTGDFIDHTEYYFENGLRKVKVLFLSPVKHNYETNLLM
jgi:hypothetical protein